jgi:small subunit ribosomal protein S17
MNNNPRNKRKTLSGVVTSRSGDKSVKVMIAYKIPHPRYTKVINRKTVVHAHDEKNEAKLGDKVVIMETRPLSKLKRWRIVEVVESAPVEADVAAAAAESIAQQDS